MHLLLNPDVDVGRKLLMLIHNRVVFGSGQWVFTTPSPTLTASLAMARQAYFGMRGMFMSLMHVRRVV